MSAECLHYLAPREVGDLDGVVAMGRSEESPEEERRIGRRSGYSSMKNDACEVGDTRYKKQ